MLVSSSNCYKFLLAVPFGSKSLHHLFTSIALNLGEAGHEATTVSCFKSSTNHPNVTHINLFADKPPIETNVFELKDLSQAMEKFTADIMMIGELMWSDERIKQLWKSRNQFDAVLTPSYLNEIAFPFLIDFPGNYIIVSTPGVEYFAVGMSGHWLPPSVVPATTLPYDEHMTLLERTANVLILTYISIAYTPKQALWQHDLLLNKFFPTFGPTASYYDRVSFTLINGDPVLDAPLPLLPTQVQIGTINAKEPQPLPQDLEEFASGSGEAGVILFSIGSIAKATDIPMRAKLEFVKAFGKLEQRVIWKYEGDDMELPANVITRPWVPQQDVLGHPRTRLFISHCGNLGTQEAKYHGVPVLAVPIAFDQPRNAARLVRGGYGLSLDWDTLTEASVLEAIHTILDDESYAQRLRNVSIALRDQKERPGERAVWWLEYAIRNRGRPHMRYPGARLHFLQYICLDVFAVLLAVALTTVGLAWLVVRKTLAGFRRAIAYYRTPPQKGVKRAGEKKKNK